MTRTGGARGCTFVLEVAFTTRSNTFAYLQVQLLTCSISQARVAYILASGAASTLLTTELADVRTVRVATSWTVNIAGTVEQVKTARSLPWFSRKRLTACASVLLLFARLAGVVASNSELKVVRPVDGIATLSQSAYAELFRYD